jgi:hypothetical protein
MPESLNAAAMVALIFLFLIASPFKSKAGLKQKMPR